MEKETKFDYDSELDILHVYTSEIDSGIKGNLTYGNFNIDVREDGKIVGIELEGASSFLKMGQETLSNLDKVMIVIKKTGNILFIGFTVIKGQVKSTIQLNIPNQTNPICN